MPLCNILLCYVTFLLVDTFVSLSHFSWRIPHFVYCHISPRPDYKVGLEIEQRQSHHDIPLALCKQLFSHIVLQEHTGSCMEPKCILETNEVHLVILCFAFSWTTFLFAVHHSLLKISWHSYCTPHICDYWPGWCTFDINVYLMVLSFSWGLGRERRRGGGVV